MRRVGPVPHGELAIAPDHVDINDIPQTDTVHHTQMSLSSCHSHAPMQHHKINK